MHVLFWDIDGTLLTTRQAGVFALEEACRVVIGQPIDFAKVDMRGVPDSEIAARLLRLAGQAPDDTRISRFLRVYEEHLPGVLGRRDGMALPGVVRLLERLRERKDVLSLLLTGNTRAGARAKLRHFGLDGFFDQGAFADDSRDRVEIARKALAVAEAQTGAAVPKDRRFVIGDTPHDIHCANAIEARTIAVATGGYALHELTALQPWVAWAALPEPEAFLRTLGLDEG